MQTLTRKDLMSLEKYAEERSAFRARVMAHKRDRQVAVGAHATLYFEDRLTIQYQIQEMLRIEKIFEAGDIEEELKAYNPLIPDGANWKATFMLEYEDVAERRAALARLSGVAERVYVRIGDHPRVYAVADEDMGRENDDKTSAVHFLRFDLAPALVVGARGGAAIACGIDHPAYKGETILMEAQRAALLADLA
ncbi:DUF3501 family protein [Acidiferrobacter sp.]|jgi:hypothetical protein|uniref:DUF3501 family protein n=1 Tax=Acidiferrobacter sp. TaxID=1872107 RepID=UPI00262CF951|nr:DUF3501 family protein [Acidiferrobacter sp.]